MPRFVAYEDAKAYAHREKFRTERWWAAHTSADGRPANVPSRPDNVYADSGWVSWRAFLGPKCLSYEKASQAAQSMGVTTIVEYKWQVEFLKRRESLVKRGCGLPVCADRQCPTGDGGRFSWQRFLGREGEASCHPPGTRVYESYDRARRWAHEHGVETWDDWRARELPTGFPANPAMTYGRSGEWRGWKAFSLD